MKTKKIAFSILFCLISIVTFSQTSVSYAYDASGNRISRTIVFKKVAKPNLNQDSIKNQEYFDQFKDATVKIFPNPTDGIINIEILNFKSDDAFILEMFDISGKLVYKKENITTIDQIDISSLIMGNYTLKITLGKETRNWKVIKI